jgi:hypothetical protein
MDVLSSKVNTVLLLAAAIALSDAAMAEDASAVEAPPPPEAMQPGEALEPEVTIREAETETVHEYRVAGKLVMVKVQPKGGMPPYYFFDRDGDGELEYSHVHPRHVPSVNQWVLFRWW